MGRGNWLPNRASSYGYNYRLVYVEIIEPDCEDSNGDPWAVEFAYQDFLSELKYHLPASFTWFGADRNSVESRDGDQVVARNGLFDLVIDEKGDYWHQGIALVVRDDAPAFAESKLDVAATDLFDSLSEIYDLSVRCCAWTSAPYKPSGETTQPSVTQETA